MSVSRSSFGQVYLCQTLRERIINYLAPVKLLISSLSLPLCCWLISHRSYTTTFINAKVISLPARRKPLFGRYRWIPGPLKRLESHRINIFLAFGPTVDAADADKKQLSDWMISIISSLWTRYCRALIVIPFVKLLSAIESLTSFLPKHLSHQRKRFQHFHFSFQFVAMALYRQRSDRFKMQLEIVSWKSSGCRAAQVRLCSVRLQHNTMQTFLKVGTKPSSWLHTRDTFGVCLWFLQ